MEHARAEGEGTEGWRNAGSVPSKGVKLGPEARTAPVPINASANVNEAPKVVNRQQSKQGLQEQVTLLYCKQSCRAPLNTHTKQQKETLP